MQNTSELWRERWLKPEMPRWDLYGAHPLLKTLLQYAIEDGNLPKEARIFEPAAGRAHNGATLASLGYHVTAEDIVPEAIEKANDLYKNVQNLTLRVGNSLITDQSENELWDMVFDRAALCALSGKEREDFVVACTSKLKPGGLFASITFTKTSDDVAGPPFAISFPDLVKIFSKDFTLIKAEHRLDGSVDQVIKEEIINIWRKR